MRFHFVRKLFGHPLLDLFNMTKDQIESNSYTLILVEMISILRANTAVILDKAKLN